MSFKYYEATKAYSKNWKEGVKGQGMCSKYRVTARGFESGVHETMTAKSKIQYRPWEVGDART